MAEMSYPHGGQLAFARDRRAQMVDYLMRGGRVDEARDAAGFVDVVWWRAQGEAMRSDIAAVADRLRLLLAPGPGLELDPRTASAVLMACQDDGPEGTAAARLVCRRLRSAAESVKQLEGLRLHA